MRVATLLLCFLLAGCAGGMLPGQQPSAFDARASATAEPAVNTDPLPGSQAERVQKARARCWVKVESEKGIRDIETRIAFIDRCVAEQTGVRPST